MGQINLRARQSTNFIEPSMSICKADVVEFLPQYRDEGDEDFIWVAVDDEQKARVTLAVLGTNLRIAPTTVACSAWIKVVRRANPALLPSQANRVRSPELSSSLCSTNDRTILLADE